MADQNIRNGSSEEVPVPAEFSELQKTFIDYKGEVEYAIQTSIGSGSKVVVPPFQVWFDWILIGWPSHVSSFILV